MADYEQTQQDEFNEFLDYKKQKQREAGIVIEEDETGLGKSVHKETIKSYQALGLPVEDSVRLATTRPGEKKLTRLQQLAASKNKKVKIWKIVRSVYRLLEESTGTEYMKHSYTLYFKGFKEDELEKVDYDEGMHEVVTGRKVLDANYRLKGGIVEGRRVVFDDKWDSKKFLSMIEQHNKDVKELKTMGPIPKESFSLGLYVGYAGKRGVSNDQPHYSIKNAQDMANGTHLELVTLARRALSGPTNTDIGYISLTVVSSL